MKTAYSYLRLSSQQQLEGDGYRRQLEATQQAAIQNNWTLSEQTFRDLGVSAFKGANAVSGAFRQFLDLVEEGKIQKGSVLIVENPDRISRESPRKSVGMLLTLLDAGVEIYTLSDNRHYQDSTNEDTMNLMSWMLAAQRGHEESLIKSQRVKAAKEQAHKAARETGKIITKQCPQWMKVVGEGDNRRFELIPERVSTVELIFKLRIEGYGMKALIAYLNESKVPTFSKNAKHWREHTVKDWLRSQKVLGHFQPLKSIRTEEGQQRSVPDGDLILNYYPRVIDDETYRRVQGTFKEGVKGRVSRDAKNLFRGLFRCQCGSAMHVAAHRHKQVTKKYGVRNRVYYRLKCNTAQTGVCKNKNLDYEQIEGILLLTLNHLDWSNITDKHIESTNNEYKTIKAELLEIQDELDETEKQLSNLINLAASMSNNTHLAERIEDLTAQNAKAVVRKEKLEARRNDLSVTRVEKETRTRDLRSHFVALTNAIDYDEAKRFQTNQMLRRELEKVTITALDEDDIRVECYSKNGDSICNIFTDKKLTSADVFSLGKEWSITYKRKPLARLTM